MIYKQLFQYNETGIATTAITNLNNKLLLTTSK